MRAKPPSTNNSRAGMSLMTVKARKRTLFAIFSAGLSVLAAVLDVSPERNGTRSRRHLA